MREKQQLKKIKDFYWSEKNWNCKQIKAIDQIKTTTVNKIKAIGQRKTATVNKIKAIDPRKTATLNKIKAISQREIATVNRIKDFYWSEKNCNCKQNQGY